MRILILQDDLYGYLAYVVGKYARGGVDLDECLGLHHLNAALKSARQFDDKQVARLAITPEGDVSLPAEAEPEPPNPDDPGLPPGFFRAPGRGNPPGNQE